MTIATEPIGSIVRPLPVVAAVAQHTPDASILKPPFADTVRDTIFGAPS
jgi:hypothetical protein